MGKMPANMRRLLWFALLVACVVVPLGAYVRLSDAGLGCPDWPGCYGKLSPAHAREVIVDVHAADPHGPVSLAKAWKEMSHRYLASALGLVIVGIAWLAWRQRTQRLLAGTLLAAVVFQGLLGMWTVTLLLKPAIVSLHLIGGISIVALIAALLARASLAPLPAPPPTRALAWALVAAVAVQVLLGGWVTSNYAAPACQGFPQCNGAWWPEGMDFMAALHVTRALGEGPDGTPLAWGALVAIHWLHRAGALLLSVLLAALLWHTRAEPAWRASRWLLLSLWALQVGLGVANVVFALPLPLAVAHNAGAMLLAAGVLSVAVRARAPLTAAIGRRLYQFGQQGGVR